MLGACPGEKLPTFPRPTHRLGRGLKAPVTVTATLARVRPDGVSLHNPRAEKIKNREPWNPERGRGPRPPKVPWQRPQVAEGAVAEAPGRRALFY
jgi:hypothetical protein